MNNTDIKILIACHKKCPVPSDPVYLPVQVGAEGKQPIGFTPDNTGGNISAKNFMYSEMTGLYWAWKNLTCGYIGLVHYSRFLAMKAKLGTASLDDVLTSDDVKRLLAGHRIILPRRRKYYIETIYSHYSHTLDGSHLDAAREVIAGKCPEYLPCFDNVMGRTWAHLFNMFIMPKTLADEYCAWLFPILEGVEGRIDRSGMNQFQKRFVGAVSERLLDVWLDWQVKAGKIQPDDMAEVPYIYTRKINWPQKITAFLAAKFLGRHVDHNF
ncbi:MAG: DUF4422 domain-containing protein [Synergistaceae bacterium]|nr:DUF4422 domain-containing protein [Synergistaceae bacterium]MBQ6971470.1 DUF4422 domain-containing protein [Synergistaceae bacterium]